MRGVQNCNYDIFQGDSLYGFPICTSFNTDIDFNNIKWRGFDKIKNIENFDNIGIHFYIDDFKFESVWIYPHRYIDLFKKAKCVIMPDFSLYYNYPVAIQMYNKYRNHWLYCFYKNCGVNIIPNINISCKENWDWSFISYPKYSVIAHSCIGISKHCDDDLVGLNKIYSLLLPNKVLYFNRCKEVPDMPGLIDCKIPFIKG